MQPKRRQKDRPRRSFFRPPPAAAAGAISRPRARERVSDGPISSNSGRNGGKNAGRNYVSALPQRAVPGRGFPHLLAGIARCHRCRTKGLRVRSPARRLPRPLAPATVGVFLSYRCTSQAFPSSGAPPIPWRRQPPPTKAALGAALARFDNRPTSGGGFKRRGPKPPPLSLQGVRILKERGKFEIPLSLSGVLWLLSFDMKRKQLAPAGATPAYPRARKS